MAVDEAIFATRDSAQTIPEGGAGRMGSRCSHREEELVVPHHEEHFCFHSISIARKGARSLTDIPTIGNNPVGPLDRLPVNGTKAVRPAEPIESESSPRAEDRVELSSHARYLDQLRFTPEVRESRVEDIRQAIAEDRYETDTKVDNAIDRLLDDLLS